MRCNQDWLRYLDFYLIFFLSVCFIVFALLSKLLYKHTELLMTDQYQTVPHIIWASSLKTNHSDRVALIAFTLTNSLDPETQQCGRHFYYGVVVLLWAPVLRLQ